MYFPMKKMGIFQQSLCDRLQGRVKHGKTLKQKKQHGAEPPQFVTPVTGREVFWNNLCFSSSTSTSIIQAWKSDGRENLKKMRFLGLGPI